MKEAVKETKRSKLTGYRTKLKRRNQPVIGTPSPVYSLALLGSERPNRCLSSFSFFERLSKTQEVPF